MKQHIFLLCLLAAASAPLHAQNPGDSLFAGVQVHTINLRFPQARYWDSLTIYYNQGNEQYIPAQAVVNGIVLDSIGVRLKGNSSYSHPNNKKSIRLSFDEYRGTNRWDGLKGIHLNNCWGDPTFMREKLHSDFCREAGIPVPRVNYARVYFNDTLWGLYTVIEHVDKVFLNSRYANDGGDLFKAVDAFGTGTVSDFRWYGTAENLYYSRYEMKTEESTTAWVKLVKLLDTLNNNPNTATALPRVVNLTRLYRAVAADVLFGNLDAYVNSGRNFYFYIHPTTGLMEWIPWDLGLSFGSYTGGIQNMEQLNVTYVSSATNRPLIGKYLNTPSMRGDYLRELCLLFNSYFSSTRLFPHIDSIANIIRPHVTADPRKMYTLTQFETNIVSDINASGGGGTRKPGLKSFINLRSTSVQSQLAGLGVSCALTVNAGDVVINEFMAQNDSIPDPAGEFDDWIEFYNNTANPLNLGGMYLSDDPTLPTKWQFPANTIIDANGYLIVWADNDSGQAGLHANFALSANGEQIIFSNTNVSILDSVTFGAQVTNRSMARIPNGTGPFLPARPTIAANNNSGLIVNPVLTTIILPHVMQGNTGTNVNRVPFAFRARITGLLPNATYRYFNQAVTSADAGTANGAGNCILVPASGDFTRTTGPSLSVDGAYGTFTSDAVGLHEGWFVTEPTGNARFTPGGHLFMRIALNDGGTGTTVAARLTTLDSVRVVKLDAAASDSTGTGLRATSSAAAKDFVFAFDNISGTGRPVSGTFVEHDGTANTLANNYAAFYAGNVDGLNGMFGMVVPNALPDGIRRFERRSRTTGALLATATDADGVWPSGANTVNPSGGTSEIVLTGTDVSLVTSVRQTSSLPAAFSLSQNYPNPFNPATTIGYQLSAVSHVTLKVYDLLGREVATLVNDEHPAGSYIVTFDAAGLASGVYIYKMHAGEFVQTRRMVLLK